MRINKILVLVISVLTAGLLFSSCSEEETHPIVGEWMQSGYTYDISLAQEDDHTTEVISNTLDSIRKPYEDMHYIKFKMDGKMWMNERASDDMYTLENNVVTFIPPAYDAKAPAELKYVIEGNKLILSYDLTDHYNQSGLNNPGENPSVKANKIAINSIFVQISNR